MQIEGLMQLQQNKLHGNLNVQKKLLSGPARTPQGELTALLQTPYWWGGTSCPLPKNPFGPPTAKLH